MEASTSSSYFGSLSFEQVLDDLSSRFIVNLPAEELESIERICFQIEQAHWYYEDFVRPQASHLPSFSLRKFSEIIFKSNPLLSHFDAATAYDQFLRYKERVPVCGAILISSAWDKCLVVKGWKSGASWSFPRGKINQGEEERDCAVREVWEETGYDISPHFNPSVTPHESNSATCPPPLPPGDYPDDDYLECIMKEQRIRLYLVPNVSEDTLFETKTRKEISKIAWAPFTSLPTWSRKSKNTKKELKCYMVTPFVNPLKEWIKTHRKQQSKSQPASHIQATEHSLEGSATIARHETPDEHIAAKTQALQEFFFGNQSPVPGPSSSFEPSTTTQASKTHTSSLPPQASRPNFDMRDQYPLYPQQTPPTTTTNPQAQARYLQNLDVLSPLPQSPGRSADTLHRLVMRRGYEGTGAQAASPAETSTSGPDTAKAASTYHRTQSNVGSPSFTDYRNSALSPSSFDMYPARIIPARAPTYTEAEREEARNDLLSQLASQLGTPTPPSADEGTDGTSTTEDDDENGASRQATPVLDLLSMVKTQVQPSTTHTLLTSSANQGFLRPNGQNNTLSPQPAPLHHLQHRSSSQHMLSILNAPPLNKPALPSPVTVPQPTQTGPRFAQQSAQQHAGSLLSLFNTGKPNAGTATNGQAEASSDLARLFANVRT